jgi:hypothetical protein
VTSSSEFALFASISFLYESRPGRYIEALVLLTHMQLHDGLIPTTAIYNLVMTACDTAANYAKVMLTFIHNRHMLLLMLDMPTLLHAIAI